MMGNLLDSGTVQYKDFEFLLFRFFFSLVFSARPPPSLPPRTQIFSNNKMYSPIDRSFLISPVHRRRHKTRISKTVGIIPLTNPTKARQLADNLQKLGERD